MELLLLSLFIPPCEISNMLSVMDGGRKGKPGQLWCWLVTYAIAKNSAREEPFPSA